MINIYLGNNLFGGPTSPFTLDHYRNMLQLLIQRGDIEFITYDQLSWTEGDSHVEGYPKEWALWSARPRDGSCKILIQHDCDSGPFQTQEMIALESEYGIISTSMVFNKWQVKGEGNGSPIPYPIDWKYLQSMEKMGFVFGYHTNAVHNANFDISCAIDLFNEDVEAISSIINLKYFSPHGGKVINGVGNATVDFLSITKCKLKHVHNRFSPKFASTYSDGGLLARAKAMDPRLDFSSWVNNLKPNLRYRILIHPQYYSYK